MCRLIGRKVSNTDVYLIAWVRDVHFRHAVWFTRLLCVRHLFSWWGRVLINVAVCVLVREPTIKKYGLDRVTQVHFSISSRGEHFRFSLSSAPSAYLRAMKRRLKPKEATSKHGSSRFNKKVVLTDQHGTLVTDAVPMSSIRWGKRSDTDYVARGDFCGRERCHIRTPIRTEPFATDVSCGGQNTTTNHVQHR